MTTKLSSQITRCGVSESFNSFIDGLRETPGLSDNKYRLIDVNKMAQYLVCRNYGKVCLEFSYLAWAIVNYSKNHTDTPLLSFFWLNESITPARFRQAFKAPLTCPRTAIILNELGLELTLSNKTFVISPTRVGLLAVLLEVIMTLAPNQLSMIESLLKDSEDDKKIKELSSILQKQLYQFLSEHLVQAQQQRRFRYISQWLTSHKSSKTDNDKHNEENTFALTDDVILSFWQHAGIDGTSPGYKLYASAFNDIIETHQAIKQAKQALALDNAKSIGFTVEAGEFSPEFIESILFDEVTIVQDYVWLCHSPKFLTKSQWRFIEPLMKKQAYIKTLALSFARLSLFGQWQASIVQAKRKSLETLQVKLNAAPENTYLTYQDQLTKQSEQITQVTLAIAHTFYHHKDSRYLGCIQQYLPNAITKNFKRYVESKLSLVNETDERSIKLTPESLNRMLFIHSQKMILQSMEFKEVMKKAQAAFNKNNKEGFQQVSDIKSLDIYQEGHEAITLCQQTIQLFSTQLSKKWLTCEDAQLNYGSDVSIFKDMFNQLYGEMHD